MDTQIVQELVSKVQELSERLEEMRVGSTPPSLAMTANSSRSLLEPKLVTQDIVNVVQQLGRPINELPSLRPPKVPPQPMFHGVDFSTFL